MAMLKLYRKDFNDEKVWIGICSQLSLPPHCKEVNIDWRTCQIACTCITAGQFLRDEIVAEQDINEEGM